MGELQEIRRFWPWVRAKDQKQDRGFYPRNSRGVYMGLGYSEALWKFPAGWSVWVTDDRLWQTRKSNPWSGSDIKTEAGVRHATIAAAMAAAGFAARKVGKYRSLRLFLEAENRHPWDADNWKPYKTPLQSRQRPRKKVRLGKRGRRLALAASMGEALDATKHWRGK